MYDSWYSQQYHQYDDSFNSQWEIFGIRAQQYSGRLESLVRLSAAGVLGWLELGASATTQIDTRVPQRAGFCLIFTRHQEHRYQELKPCYLAFNKKTFKKILHAMKLPSAYSFMRVNAGASGNFSKYSTFDENGSISLLTFVIRVPHSPRISAKAVWSLAVSWDANTGSTAGLFESLSDEDIRDVEGYLTGRVQQRQHPLFLPTMLLDLLTVFYVEHRKRLEHSLFIVESQLGITRGQRKTDAWDWNYELHRDTTKHCNSVYTSLVYLERQLDFAAHLGDFILQCIAYCQEEVIFPPAQRERLLKVSKELKESVVNNQNFASCQLNQVLCLQKRTQALVSVMYSVVAQKDSRTNVGIAKAAKRDSSSMTAIAVLGIIFLPAMLVASLFSTSMFDFSQVSSSPSRSSSVFVSSDFWIFWAITIPLTLVVLAIWGVWMRRVQKSVPGDGSKDEESIAYRDIQTEHPPCDPFYPTMGIIFSDGKG